MEREAADKYGFRLFVPERNQRENGWQMKALECAAIVTERIRISKADMEKLPYCRVIVRTGIGFDQIDVDAATERGVHVYNVPDYCTEEVALHTLTLLLCMARRLPSYADEMDKRNWSFQIGKPPQRFSSQVVGIVGFGKTAQALCDTVEMLAGSVLVHTRHPEKYQTGMNSQNRRVRFVALDELLEASDYVVLLLPLTETTYHLIRRETLERMKPGAYLINTARGGLVEENDLADALSRGTLAGAALDVLEQEPPLWEEHRLSRLPNVWLTPHTAFYSTESLRDLRRQSIETAAKALLGHVLPNLVNPRLLCKGADG